MTTITIEEGLVVFLKAHAGLAALVGVRIKPDFLPQKSDLPCLTYQRISTPRVITHDTTGSAGTAYPRIQFDAYAITRKGAKAIVDQLRAALQGYTGSMGTSPNTVTVQAAIVDDEEITREPETGFFRGRSDYLIWHQEA